MCDPAQSTPNKAHVTVHSPAQPPSPPDLKHAPTGAASEWLTAFAPHRGLVNGHLQTIVGNFLPRPDFRLPFVTDTVEVDAADGSRVLCHSHWQSGSDFMRRLTMVLVHGLEGS